MSASASNAEMPRRESAVVFENLLAQAPVLAILRHADSTSTAATAQALADAGVALAEVTTTTPGWTEIVRAMDRRILPGVGSVTTTDQVEEAAAQGARFIVSPGLDRDVVGRTLALGMEPVPGCVTATEVQVAHRLGVRTIKLYPAGVFGPAYVEALRAPYPGVRLLPTGGVTIDAILDWMAAGAVGVALGADLVGRTSSGDPVDLEALRERTRHALALATASHGAGT